VSFHGIAPATKARRPAAVVAGVWVAVVLSELF